jgi:hypothetical protein
MPQLVQGDGWLMLNSEPTYRTQAATMAALPAHA